MSLTPPPLPSPAVGRIVHYQLVLDGGKIVTRAAMITNVHEFNDPGTSPLVDLHIFPVPGRDGIQVRDVLSVYHDQAGAGGTWKWMDHQLQQAEALAMVANQVAGLQEAVFAPKAQPGSDKVVNLVDFGAKADGSDSMPALLAAFAALAPDGGTLLIPEGTFTIYDTPPAVPKGVILKGEPGARIQVAQRPKETPPTESPAAQPEPAVVAEAAPAPAEPAAPAADLATG